MAALMPTLDLGPVLRTLRRQPGVLALVVLEIAAGVTTISSLTISGFWYRHIGTQPSGLDERNLILVSTYSPARGQERAVDLGDLAASEPRGPAQPDADRSRILQSPGVEAATWVTSTILDDRWTYPTLFAARAAATAATAGDGERDRARARMRDPIRDDVGWAVFADPDLARTVGLRFIRGASPTAAGTDRPTAAVLSECLAGRLFGKVESAVGGVLSSAVAADVPVVGVVEDVRMRMPFMPHSRCVAFLFGGHPHEREVRFIVRARPGRREAALASLRHSFGPETERRYIEVRPFDSTAGAYRRIAHGLVNLLGTFCVLVGVVALLGALAATSFLVAQRTRQIGIRRALGATRSDIVSYFILESTLATAMGSLLGVLGTIGVFRMMRRVFQDISLDWSLLAGALTLFWLATILATLIPALRAARVPPSMATRSL